MKILNLIIKQEWFDKILSGEKTIETRNITPTTASKYIYYKDSNGKTYKAKEYSQIPEDVEIEGCPLPYDAIHFFVGYKKDRQSALVQVTDAEIVILKDSEGYEMVYEVDGETYVAAQINYSLGKILEN